MPRRIVFVNQATGYLTIDIINAFVDKYDKVAVIYGDIRIQDIKLDIRVQKSKIIEKSRKSNFNRFISWSIATLQITFLLITRYRKYEIFYFSVPPFAYFNSLLIRRKFSLLMWDVYPDALKIVGIKETHFLYETWIRINKKLFKRAFRIYTVGYTLASLLSKYINGDIIRVIPLWTGITNIQPIEKKTNPFIKEHNLEGKFIVQYSGNMGPTIPVEVLISVARMTRSDREIAYLFVGRGLKYEVIKQMIRDEKLENCILLPFQPDNVIRYSLAAADLSVVMVEDNVPQVSIPSKVYNIMAIGSPILSIAPEISEINSLINKCGNGMNFAKSNIDGIVRFIRWMKNTPEILQVLRNNSIVASKEFSPDNAKLFLKDYLSK